MRLLANRFVRDALEVSCRGTTGGDRANVRTIRSRCAARRLAISLYVRQRLTAPTAGVTVSVGVPLGVVPASLAGRLDQRSCATAPPVFDPQANAVVARRVERESIRSWRLDFARRRAAVAH